MIRRKVCMLGAFAVGKTSLVRRFVDDSFSDRYQSTVGVKIHKRRLSTSAGETSLLIWDLHGDDEYQPVRTTYLRGASGLFLVADGTRPGTLERALELADLARGAVGEIPLHLLVNKVDLDNEWVLEADQLDSLVARGWSVHRTSAKSGDGVEEAFHSLAEAMNAE